MIRGIGRVEISSPRGPGWTTIMISPRQAISRIRIALVLIGQRQTASFTMDRAETELFDGDAAFEDARELADAAEERRV